MEVKRGICEYVDGPIFLSLDTIYMYLLGVPIASLPFYASAVLGESTTSVLVA